MGVLTYQKTDYSCGLHAFRNAVQVLGVDLSYKESRKLVGMTKDGTSIRGLLRGAQSLNLKAVEYRQPNPFVAWKWLIKWTATCPVILLVDDCLSSDKSHWVTALAVNGERVVVADSSYPRDGETGVYIYNRDELLARWKQRICYGIRLSQ